MPIPRAYPAGTQAARRLNEKHLVLFDARLERLSEEPVLVLAGRVLTPEERADLVVAVQRAVLPELHGGPLPGPGGPGRG